MDHARAQDAQRSKDERRPIRRVQSPSRPRAWMPSSDKSKFGEHFYRRETDRNQRYHHPNAQDYFDRRNYYQPKFSHNALRVTEEEKTRRYEWRESADGGSLPKENKATRSFLPNSNSSRDKDMRLAVYYQECEMFGLVTKMLIEKDPSLERLIQSSLQENLRDIGKRCVDAMEKFIQGYDSRESSH